ncbi:MAG: PaaI family thioesterase [Candidatus Kerfeldbacteria bacterium]
MGKYEGLPTELTRLAKLLGADKLGKFNAKTKKYSVEITNLNPEALSFYKFAHGGAIGALFDDTVGMCIYFCYGINSAITASQTVKFINVLSMKSPFVITCWIDREGKKTGDEIIMKGEATTRSGKVIATMEAVWIMR